MARDFTRSLNAVLRRVGKKKEKDFHNRFFSEWFRHSGGAYYFLFRKNLNHTNIQFGELLSLVKLHATGKNGRKFNLHCVSRNDFIASLQDLQRSFKDAAVLSKLLQSEWRSGLETTVVFEPFFGSCTVFVPPHIELDLAAICAESGYVHSCGRNVYTRLMQEATAKELADQINTVLPPLSSKKFMTLAVYSHEDFSKIDRNYASELKAGLDDVKVHVEKWFLGNQSLVSALADVKKKCKARLLILPPGDATKHRESAINDGVAGRRCERKNSLWLIVDRSVQAQGDRVRSGREQYVICYRQDYKNESPFQVFDENKPAWIAQTTAPHSLTAAMINVARPFITPRKRTSWRVLDPFGGTGTTFLECLKLVGRGPVSSDHEPLCAQVTRDNLDVIVAPPEDIERYRSGITVVRDYVLAGDQGSSEPIAIAGQKYSRANKWFKEWGEESKRLKEPHRCLRSFRALSADERLLVYLLFRTRVRHDVAFLRGSDEWKTAFADEVNRLDLQLEDLCRIRRAALKARTCGQLAIYTGTFSEACTVAVPSLQKSRLALSRTVLRRDATTILKRKMDLIVTDPPYGFNHHRHLPSLARLFAKAVRAMLSNLADEGQLVLCLPNESFSGKPIAGFARPGWVSQQILVEARKLKREVISSADVAPSPARVFRYPFYWESERALGRSVLHFRIKRRK